MFSEIHSASLGSVASYLLTTVRMICCASASVGALKMDRMSSATADFSAVLLT